LNYTPHLAVGPHVDGYHSMATYPPSRIDIMVAVCKDRNAVDLRHILPKKDALVSIPTGRDSLVRLTFQLACRAEARQRRLVRVAGLAPATFPF
jgi:hypothetical protein